MLHPSLAVVAFLVIFAFTRSMFPLMKSSVPDPYLYNPDPDPGFCDQRLKHLQGSADWYEKSASSLDSLAGRTRVFFLF